MQASLALINRLILTLLFVAASGGAVVGAEDIALTYGCARPLRVGIEEFGAMYHAGAGVDSDILRELSRRSGCRFEIRNLSRAEMWPAMTAGEIDLATSSISTL